MHEIVPIATQNPASRFDFFEAAVSSTFCPMSCDTPGNRRDFDASLEYTRFDQLALSVIGSAPLHVERTRGHIGLVSDAYYLVKFQLEGEALVRQREHEAHLLPGDFVMCSTSEPYSLHFESAYREAVLAVPQQRLQELMRRPDAHLGRRMAADQPVNGLLSQFVRSLSERIDRIDAGLAQRLEANVLDLLVTALECGPAAEPRALESSEQHLRRVQAYIARHLSEPDLSPDRIARAEGISTRYLHMLFRNAGESVTRCIQRQRLEACRRSLENPALNHLGVSEIGFRLGFNDSSHFNRLFKAEYGLTPRACRMRSQGN